MEQAEWNAIEKNLLQMVEADIKKERHSPTEGEPLLNQSELLINSEPSVRAPGSDRIPVAKVDSEGAMSSSFRLENSQVGKI